MIIAPTVGRIVWYWPSDEMLTEGVGLIYRKGQPFMATVCYVHNDRKVNLAGFDHAGVPWKRSGVQLAQEQAGDSVPTNGDYCTWMPYQVGQAKKHAGDAPPQDDAKQAMDEAKADLLEHESRRAAGRTFPASGYKFGVALEAARMGCKIWRNGWNGKGQFVVYMPGLQLPPHSSQGPGAKVNDRTAKWIGADTPLDCQPYFAMYVPDVNKWCPGWLASQSDMLAVDWVIDPTSVNFSTAA